jgi:uncharacterized membrane protein YoaK (UPF0700 family)
VVIELWAVEAFCLTPVIIACLFFVAGVVCVGDASVSLRLLLLVSSSWLVLSMLEMHHKEPVSSAFISYQFVLSFSGNKMQALPQL